MPESILRDVKMPFCPGCGHHIVTKNVARALQKLGIEPLDTVLVTDIGCCGIVDHVVKCHTVHGLHGRSCAFSYGVSLGLDDQSKKVIAVQGDGGATIGLRHLMDASRDNVDITLIVQNNFVYGMTGGQISGLSPVWFKSEKLGTENNIPPYDVCELAHRAGAAFSARVITKGDFSDLLVEAIDTPGFSIVEVVEPCNAYGLKSLKDLKENAQQEMVLKNKSNPYKMTQRTTASLFDDLPRIEKKYEAKLEEQCCVVIAGSAGERVQSTGKILGQAGVFCGLETSKKGDFPITVGTGFSIAEIILSRREINYSDIVIPDVMIVTSEDGLRTVGGKIGEKTLLIIDESLDRPASARTITGDFRKVAGGKEAALCATAFWLEHTGILPKEAMLESAGMHKHADEIIPIIERSTNVDFTAHQG